MRRTEVLVGAVIMAGIVLVVLGTIWLRGWGIGREQRTIEARFREVGQLLEGNVVKLRGVPIGRVEDIYLEERGGGVIVAMTISEDVSLPEDPVVLLSPESLFGDWQAEIHPRRRYPQYSYADGPDPRILPGYSLPDVSRLTAVADRIAENLAVITERVDIAFTEETALNVREAIQNIQEVSSQLTGLMAAQQQTVDELAQNLTATTVSLINAAEAARRTFARVEASIGEGELEQTLDNVQNVTVQLDTLMTVLVRLSGNMEGAVVSADSTFEALQAIATSLRQGQGTLGQLLQDTTLYRELVITNKLAQDLLQDFQRNPRKYINLRVF